MKEYLLYFATGSDLKKARDHFLVSNPTGLAKMNCWATKAVGLPARFVIFTSSPGIELDKNKKLKSKSANELVRTYVNVLEECNSRNLQFVAVPLIGAGILSLLFSFTFIIRQFHVNLKCSVYSYFVFCT